MDKLINYVTDYDNIELPIHPDEIEYILNRPYNIDIDCIEQNIFPRHNYIARIRNKNLSYVELPSNVEIKKFVTTDTTSAFISTNNEFFILYDKIQHFEKIANHIKDCITGTSTFVLITENNGVLFVNAADGNITDDIFWESDSVVDIYTIKNKFIVKTRNNSLYVYDGCVYCGFSIDELEHNVDTVIVTLDTITVLTLDKRVWVFGNPEHGAYVTEGRGFIPNINNAIQVVRTVRAGAILTQDNNVWSWGDVNYGGSPAPTWVGGIDNRCKCLLNTSTSIIAITLDGQLWAWSNRWFKTYSMIDSDYAIASCILPELKMDNIIELSENKLSWIIKTRCNTTFYIGKSIKKYTDLNSFIIYNNDYIWLLYDKYSQYLIFLNDEYFKTFENVTSVFSNINSILVESCKDKTRVYSISLSPFGEIQQTVRIMKGNIRNVLLTKYGNMYVSDLEQVYKDSHKIYHKFTNIIFVYCNMVEILVLMYIPKQLKCTSNSTILPSTTRPSTTRPSTILPSTTRPSTILPSTTRPSTILPSTTRPSTTLPITTRPSTILPITTRPSTTLPITTRPSTTLPITTRPSTILPSTTRPSTTRPSTTRPSTILPSTTRPSTTLPITTRPSTILPSTTRPSTTRPSTTRPSTTRPSTILPSTTRPSTILPSTTRPSTTLPSTTRPSTTRSIISNTISAINTTLTPSHLPTPLTMLPITIKNTIGNIFSTIKKSPAIHSPTTPLIQIEPALERAIQDVDKTDNYTILLSLLLIFIAFIIMCFIFKN
jgi:hypothetical protein